jgi:putative tricarboxylic transport membrane protein
MLVGVGWDGVFWPNGWIGQGFLVALSPTNLLFCFIGVLMGTLIGVLPGIGPVSGVAILLPIVFTLEPTAAMIMLAGIYYGSMYGGSTTSILINTPGESASVMTCLDGYAMARQGRAGIALGMSAIASFIAGTVSVVGLMLLGAVLSLAWPLLVRLFTGGKQELAMPVAEEI